MNPPFDTASALRWLRQLKKNNDRAWYAAHKEPYDKHIRYAWEDLVAALVFTGVKADPRLAQADPRRCIFRLANDTRFHKDKPPYKTRLSAWLSPRGWSGAYAGYYVSVAPGGSHFSAGIYVPERPVLDALRRTIAADRRPLERILRGKALAPYLPLRLNPLMRMPRGFPKEHPAGELLRARMYLVGRDYTDAEITHAGAFALFQRAMRACAPFVRYVAGVADAASSAAIREPIDGWEENSISAHFGPSSSARF